MQEQIDPVVARRVAAEAAPVPVDAVQRTLVEYLRPRANINPEEAMKIMAGREIPPRTVAESFIDQMIGPADLPVVTAVVRGENVPRKNRAGRPAFEAAGAVTSQNRVGEVYEFLERGTITNGIRGEVLRILYNDPGYRTILAEVVANINVAFPGYMANPATIPAGLRTIIDEILQNPGYNSQLRTLLKERIDITKPLEDNVTKANSEVTALQNEVTRLQNDLNPAIAGSSANQIAGLQADLNQYLNTIALGPGLRFQQIQQLAKDMAVADANRKVIEIDLQAQAALIADRATAPPIRTVAQGQMKVDQVLFQNANKAYEAGQAERQGLEADKTRIDNELKELQTRIRTVREQETTRSGELAKKRGELAPTEADRRIKEQNFIDNITGMFADATVKHLDDRLARINSNYERLNKERTSRETDETARELSERIRQRYLGPMRTMFRPSLRRAMTGGPFALVQEREFLGKQTEEDMNSYRAGGAREMMEDLIGDQLENQIRLKYGIVAPNPLTPVMQQEIDKRLTELAIGERGNEIVTNMLVTRTRLGRNLSLNDARIVQRFNPGILKEIVNRDVASRKEIQDIAKNNGIDDLSRLPEGLFPTILSAAIGGLAFGFHGLFGTRRDY